MSNVGICLKLILFQNQKRKASFIISGKISLTAFTICKHRCVIFCDVRKQTYFFQKYLTTKRFICVSYSWASFMEFNHLIISHATRKHRKYWAVSKSRIKECAHYHSSLPYIHIRIYLKCCRDHGASFFAKNFTVKLKNKITICCNTQKLFLFAISNL